MDEDLIEGGDAPTTPEDTGPSLIDTLGAELGFDDGGAPGEGAADTGTDAGAADAGAAGAAPAGADPAAGQADAAADPAAAAKPDPNAELYAPLPEHNPRKTHERFQRLVEGHKTVSQERDSAVQERDQFKGQIQQYEQGLQPLREMGFTDQAAVEDLQQFSQYRSALAKGDVDSAMGILQAQMNQLALASGRRVEVNPLTQFPDLAERVQVGELDERTALELARGRHGQQVQHQHAQTRQQQEQQHAQTMQAIHSGASQVTATVQELQRDIDFQAVLPALQSQLEHIKANYRPDQWAAEIKRTYAYEKRLLAAQARPAAPTRQQPLRGNGHLGGQPAPTNAADAAMQALGFD